MLCLKINVAPAKPNIFSRISYVSAFSLVEMLIAMALGSLLLLVLSSSYTHFMLAQTKQDDHLWLQKEAHQIINYFQQHIQHMGYQGQARSGSNFTFFERNNARYTLNERCLIFFYDLNDDGCLGKRATKNTACTLGELNNSKELAKEIFGFKLENQEIHLYADNKLINCSRNQCKTLLESCSENWTKLTSQELFQVDELKFSWKKPNQLLQIDLTLSLMKAERLIYQVRAYAYIFNASDL